MFAEAILIAIYFTSEIKPNYEFETSNFLSKEESKERYRKRVSKENLMYDVIYQKLPLCG